MREDSHLTPLTPASDPRLRWVGRCDVRQSAVRFAWSGSGFVVRFEGHAVGGVLADSENYFTVVVDGAVTSACWRPSGTGEQLFVSELAAGEHTVAILRRSEPAFGLSELRGLRVYGALLAPPPRPPVIEIIGDSISCGYGNETQHPSDPFTAQTENHYRSYGAILARLVNAEASTVAWSGRGVVRNYGDAPEPLVPQLYHQTLPTPNSAPWPFLDDVSLVLVNAGTNDFTTPGPDVDAFVAGYAQLLADVRARRPRTPLLCTLGPMLAPLTARRARAAVQRAVAVRQDQGDGNLVYHELRTPNLAPGCNEHPNLVTHEAMAHELADVVRHWLEPHQLPDR
jgi:lysophospholipase L1-like esterase